MHESSQALLFLPDNTQKKIYYDSIFVSKIKLETEIKRPGDSGKGVYACDLQADLPPSSFDDKNHSWHLNSFVAS